MLTLNLSFAILLVFVFPHLSLVQSSQICFVFFGVLFTVLIFLCGFCFTFIYLFYLSIVYCLKSAQNKFSEGRLVYITFAVVSCDPCGHTVEIMISAD